MAAVCAGVELSVFTELMDLTLTLTLMFALHLTSYLFLVVWNLRDKDLLCVHYVALTSEGNHTQVLSL